LLALLLLLYLAGCSSRVFLYNRLPMLLPWYLERYVDLDEEQEEQADLQIAELLAWHRREELPRYAFLVEQLQGRLGEPVDASAIAAAADDFEEAWFRLRDRALDELLQLGGSLDEGQVEDFIASLEKTQQRYRRKYLGRTDEEYREESADSLRDFLEDYLGRLGESQRAIVERAAGELQRSDSTWIGERRRWIDMLERELRREPGWQERIRDLVRDWEEQLEPQSLALYEHNTAVLQRAIAAVLEERDERQDARLARELDALREDLLRLATRDAG